MLDRLGISAGLISTIRVESPSREAFGDRVETTFVESVSGGDAERADRGKLARTGHDLIFTTSFGYMEPTIRVAERFPDVKFEHATGFRRADNVSTYAPRYHEGRYILGQIRGGNVGKRRESAILVPIRSRKSLPG